MCREAFSWLLNVNGFTCLGNIDICECLYASLFSYDDGVFFHLVGKRVGQADDVEHVGQAVVADASREGNLLEFLVFKPYGDPVHAFQCFGHFCQGGGAEVKDVPSLEVHFPAVSDVCLCETHSRPVVA